LLLNPLQPDGRIPGEAAACFVVAAQGAVQSSQTTALITTLSTEHESESFLSAHAGTSGPMQAHGLTRLFRALAPAFTSRAGVVVSGQSIEGFWGRELAYAYLRNASVMPEPFVHISTAYEIGDAGVAAGAVAIGRAVDVLHPRRTPHGATPRTALVFDVSDAGFIGGAALSQPGAIASTAR
jgi:3-oxoacyl-[acyl-carrier-protein] synthase-1